MQDKAYAEIIPTPTKDNAEAVELRIYIRGETGAAFVETCDDSSAAQMLKKIQLPQHNVEKK